MSERKKKQSRADLQGPIEEREKIETNDYDENVDWKRLEKWRPGRRNFS